MKHRDSSHYDWDDEKARANKRKHGVSFDEAVSTFSDSLFVAFSDPDHSQTENRYIIIGHSDTDRLLITGFVQRRDVVRLIWSRKVTGRERRFYEELLKGQ